MVITPFAIASSSFRCLPQRHAWRARLKDQVIQFEAWLPGDDFFGDVRRRAEKPAALHEGFGQIVRIVTGERLPFAGRGIYVK